MDEGHEQAEEVTYFDTFDWRLLKAGRRLELRNGQGTGRRQERICRLHGGATPLDVSVQGLPKKKPGMAVDLPDGPFRQTVEPLIKMRRLLPTFTVRSTAQTWNVLGAENKTVVRLRLETHRLEPHPWPGRPAAETGEKETSLDLTPRLRVEPIRGYDAADRKLRDFLHKKLDLRIVERSLFDEAAARSGLRVGGYSSKVQIRLGAGESAADATRAILLHLLDAMEINEDGTRRDVDSEFLHDFRVAVRRTRAALSQIKRVFPDDRVAHFKREFSWLGKLTGPTRDLDVYLLKMPVYRLDLPPETRQDLDPLSDFLVRKQRLEQRKLAKGLDSARYRNLVADWRLFLEGEDPPPLPSDALRPVRDVASERIWKIYRRIIKQGSVIDDSSPADDLHDVRLECKKLRYLMEFFRSLYPKSEIEGAIRALKRLQDNLGDFNDYEVQQASLGSLAEELAKRETQAATLLAMGRLQSRLAAGQQAERDAFTAKFARFAAPDEQARYRGLFKSSG